MIFGNFIDELADRLKLDRKDAVVRAVLGRKINASYKEVANVAYVDWEPLKRYSELVTVPNYATGTADIVNGSRTVNFGNGAALTSAMEGRFFQSQSSANWYKIIKVVSATQATLLSPIVETTASALTFLIWKRFYYFPSEVRRILEFGSWIRDGMLEDRSNEYFQDRASNPSLTGDPIEFTMFGVDPFEGTYSDFTISLTKDSDIATGSSTPTLFLDNVTPGDILEVGTSVYRVKRVESDTVLRLLNRSISTLTAQTYTIRKDENLGCQLWYSPNRALILPFSYIKRVYDMVNETYDRPELPEEFDKAILDGAEADRLSDLDDNRWTQKIQLYNARITDLKSSRAVSKPRTHQLRPKIMDRGSYFSGGGQY